MENEKQSLLAFAKQWDEAMVSNHADAISLFMSEDWLIVGSDGISTKETFLQFIRSGELTHHRMDADENHISLYGNTAILVSRGTSAGHFKGQPFSLYEWSTSVFIKNNGHWLCVHTMLTPAKGSTE